MKSKGLFKFNDDVYKLNDNISLLDNKTIKSISSLAKNNIKNRVRINFHSTNESTLHEMIIAMTKESKIEPHKHPNKIESCHLIKGKLRIGFLDNIGNIFKVIQLDNSDRPFYRLNNDIWHIVVPITKIVIMHEVTIGPFVKGESTIFPGWYNNKEGFKISELIRARIKKWKI